MYGMWQGPEGEDSVLREVSAGPEAEEDSSGDEEGMKAILPDGEHPFDYLFEGHQYLMAGCLLLEEIDSPLEAEELQQIKKLLDPYAERIREFYIALRRKKK